MRRWVLALAVVAALGIGAALGAGFGAFGAEPDPSPSPSTVAAEPSPSPSPVPASPTPEPTASPTRSPTITPVPTPQLVAAPLTGRLVTPQAATRHVLAVMVDDISRARPQSGFNAASVVWHAPAEGGIPRYMLLFQERNPASVGPVRSARQYYIAWASEWRSLYVHAGGSPQALRTLRRDTGSELVYDADEFRWGGRYLWRITTRFPPHNVYTDGEHLRALAARLGADDGPLEAAWRFAPDIPLERRPEGGRIEVPYLANKVTYTYERAGNRYVRSVTGASPQVDAADDKVVAPKNVVVLFVNFSPLKGSPPARMRLDADLIGEGRALISTNGGTIDGIWRKDSMSGPTQLLTKSGRPVTLTVGQTFVQVVDVGAAVKVTRAKPVPPPPDGYREPA